MNQKISILEEEKAGLLESLQEEKQMKEAIAYKLDLVAQKDEDSDMIDACYEMIDQVNYLDKENQQLRQEVKDLKNALESKKRLGITEFTPIWDDTKRLKVE